MSKLEKSKDFKTSSFTNLSSLCLKMCSNFFYLRCHVSHQHKYAKLKKKRVSEQKININFNNPSHKI